MNINNIIFQKEFYNNKKFCVIDNILNIETAKHLQKEIVESLDELDDPEKDKLRLLRADPEKYKQIYKINLK